MTDERTALDMTEPKRKLLDVATDPDRDPAVALFCRFLAAPRTLNDELVPSGFLMGCLLASHALETGVGPTGRAISPEFRSLTGLPSLFYSGLTTQIPAIADAIFPLEFAGRVRAEYEAVLEQARNANKPVP